MKHTRFDPPRIARAILLRIVPEHSRAAVADELDDEFRSHIAVTRGPMRAKSWYWDQVLRSIAPALGMRRRRHRAGQSPRWNTAAFHAEQTWQDWVHGSTREIGVRLALGADRSMIHGLVMGRCLRIVAPGLLAGAALAFVGARAVASLLFGVRPFDWTVFAAATAAVLAASLLASYLPARRALRVDPVESLRCP